MLTKHRWPKIASIIWNRIMGNDFVQIFGGFIDQFDMPAKLIVHKRYERSAMFSRITPYTLKAYLSSLFKLRRKRRKRMEEKRSIAIEPVSNWLIMAIEVTIILETRKTQSFIRWIQLREIQIKRRSWTHKKIWLQFSSRVRARLTWWKKSLVCHQHTLIYSAHSSTHFVSITALFFCFLFLFNFSHFYVANLFIVRCIGIH